MNTRQNLYELAAQHQLTAAQTAQLLQLSSLANQPATVGPWLPRGVAVLAAALGGLGVVMWIAANWETLGRFGRFGLLQALVLAAGAGAALRPAARAPLGLLALLGIGALFAYFGQTYQTGADPWQLFALWGVLALPLCLGARSDVLWAPWALVAMTAIALWTQTHTGHRWRVDADQLTVHLTAWAAVLAVVGGLSQGLQRWSGAGVWGFRTAVTLAVVAFTLTAMGGLFSKPVGPQYGLGLVLLAGCALALCSRRAFDIFALSAVALGLNALLVGGVVRWLFTFDDHGDWIGRLLLLGLFAAGLLSASVSTILKLSRRYTVQGELA
jgi:uncharacterized membrane protein